MLVVQGGGVLVGWLCTKLGNRTAAYHYGFKPLEEQNNARPNEKEVQYCSSLEHKVTSTTLWLWEWPRVWGEWPRV